MSAFDFTSVSIMSIVEGLTEFIPVSSTGHLIVTGHLLGLVGEETKSFEIFIQAGAILAIVVLYWKRFMELIDFKRTSGLAGIGGCKLIVAGCIPAVIVGAVFGSKIKHALFSAHTVGISLVVGAVIMILAEKKAKKPIAENVDQISLRQAIIIGLFQTLALIPGMSRAAMSIAGGLLCGLERRAAAEFSFLMAVPLIIAATFYDLYKSWSSLNSADLQPFAIGFFISFVTALFAVKGFMALLRKITLTPFAFYRIVVGIIIIVFIGSAD